MSLRHENLIRFLLDSTSPGETLKLVCNPGNAGDSLIALGTLLLLDSLGLRVSIHQPQESFDVNDRIFYGGGGNFVPYYKACREFFMRNRHVRQLVLLPHTVNGQRDILQQLPANVILFAREQRSFRHLTRCMTYPDNARIDHDLAFAIGPTAIRALIGSERPESSGTLHAYRRDREATTIVIPPDNRDISAICRLPGNTQTLNGIVNSSAAMLNAIAPYETVKTNRLHVAIASALMGKQTILSRNSYFKNKQIYKYSLKPHFQNIKFVNASERVEP